MHVPLINKILKKTHFKNSVPYYKALCQTFERLIIKSLRLMTKQAYFKKYACFCIRKPPVRLGVQFSFSGDKQTKNLPV